MFNNEERLRGQIKTISLMTVINFNILLVQNQKILFYCHQKNPKFISHKCKWKGFCEEHMKFPGMPGNWHCWQQRTQNRTLRVATVILGLLCRSAENSSSEWKVRQVLCDEVTFHSFLLEFHFLSLLFFPPLRAAPIWGNTICCNELTPLTALWLRCCLF